MSRMQTTQEEVQSARALNEGLGLGEGSVISPVTASQIYHAALANNRTLDNLLDSFDGGEASPAEETSHMSVSTIKDISRQRTQIWMGTAVAKPQGSRGIDTRRSTNRDDPSSPSVEQQVQSGAPLAHDPGAAPKVSTPSILRHRSPAPSMSTTTSLSSQSPASSTAFANPVGILAAAHESHNGMSNLSAARCTVCERGHSDSEQSPNCTARNMSVEPESAYRTIPQGRRSGIPQRSGRFLDARHHKSPR